ncbi:CapA family protein [Glacieibacterium megasporae]|uniref:CapA family protein n=1 Tax=Glacieibacterium megasporae TaxID=2835787 RepID=UPI001C1E4D3E|nr:CapA family protein [Polymorphobacter megasporae]UAJ11523.1 CapA family protein [Polymorphobacter megasporae]
MIEIVFLGDLILDVPEPDHWLAGIAPVTRAADIAIGHLEVPHTLNGDELVGDVPAPGADPAHLAALARAGIDIVSLGGNHIADCGARGIADTVAELDRLGIAHAGAGATLAAAQEPAICVRNGRRVALLSYNCVGPEIGWAGADRAGANYVIVRADDGGPTRPQANLIEADPASLALMSSHIAAAKVEADFVVVALHKGITHRPAELAPYERPIAHAAIDAGADVVVGHHAHIARGIEFYRGKPIFHGLGNGVVVTHALSPSQDHPARAEWAARRERVFGFVPDPAYPLAPFHPEAVNGMIGRCRIDVDGTVETAFLPVWFAPPGRPEVATGEQAVTIGAYIDTIGQRAGLTALVSSKHDGWIILGDCPI